MFWHCVHPQTHSLCATHNANNVITLLRRQPTVVRSERCPKLTPSPNQPTQPQQNEWSAVQVWTWLCTRSLQVVAASASGANSALSSNSSSFCANRQPASSCWRRRATPCARGRPDRWWGCCRRQSHPFDTLCQALLPSHRH